MVKPNDINAVVDSKARVIGVLKLRVVHASAFPFLPPGHPMATVCKLLPCSTHRLEIGKVATMFAQETDNSIDASAEKIAADILNV